MSRKFSISATFEGLMSEKTVDFLSKDPNFRELPLDKAVAKLFIVEMGRNREMFGTHLMGLPEPEELTVSVSDV